MKKFGIFMLIFAMFFSVTGFSVAEPGDCETPGVCATPADDAIEDAKDILNNDISPNLPAVLHPVIISTNDLLNNADDRVSTLPKTQWDRLEEWSRAKDEINRNKNFIEDYLKNQEFNSMIGERGGAAISSSFVIENPGQIVWLNPQPEPPVFMSEIRSGFDSSFVFANSGQPVWLNPQPEPPQFSEDISGYVGTTINWDSGQEEPSLALFEGTSMVEEVLTYYQDSYESEAYIPTGADPYSIVSLPMDFSPWYPVV